MSIRAQHPVLASAIAGCLMTMTAAAVKATEVSVERHGNLLHWHAAQPLSKQLRLHSPDGEVLEFHFEAGEPVQLEGSWQDGIYSFELSEFGQAALDRDAGDPSQRGLAGAGADKATPAAWGHFTIQGRGLQLPVEMAEPVPKRAAIEPPQTRDSTRDQVIADDLIVQGSICVGFDCVDNESFGFDKLRLKENNTRIHFLDTSAAAGFPARSWELTANDSASGGLDYLAIHDRGTNARPFWVRSNAPSHSLMIDPSGRIGVGTSVPLMHMHLQNANTPGLRLQQAGGGFGSYSWDVAGNEANFFVRDVMSGSTLPFRIQPGTPTNLLTLNKEGHVGIGLWAGQTAATLDIYRRRGSEALVRVRTGDASAPDTQMELSESGDLYINGSLTQLSSRHAKGNFRNVDPGSLLRKVNELPISQWNYLHQSEDVKHLGPTAEDFHAAFGLGQRPTEIAPSDIAGVALAAVQALTTEVAERDRRIEALEARLQQLEQHLGSLPDRH